MRILTLVTCGMVVVPAMFAEADGVALVRHAPVINGIVEGSIHQMTAEDTTLNGNATITGDLLLPGSPVVLANGQPRYAGTVDATGASSPSGYKVTMSGTASLRHVVRRTDAIPLPAVAAPAAPAGTRSAVLNGAGQSPGDFSTLRHLTLNGGTGQISVPAGIYGNFIANAGGFVLGAPDATVPTRYDFQSLVLNGNSSLSVVGPVIVTVNGGLALSGLLGAREHPGWLLMRLTGGGLTLNGSSEAYLRLEAPDDQLILNGSSSFAGTVAVDRLTLNGHTRLKLMAPPDNPPAFPDADHDGMDDHWESANGLNPLIDDSSYDNDRDGVPNLTEFILGLNPSNPDSDGDGLYDGDEIALGLNPKVPNPDNEPPSAPTGLTKGVVSTDRVTLSWQPATDNLKVSGYIVYRDGQPVETELPIRETTFTDTNLPDGEEFTYQVRAFDFVGNLSPLSAEVFVTTTAADTDHDGLPDEWELKYFGEEPAAPDDDPDGDGQTNLQEFQAGTDPKNFYNGVNPLTEAINAAGEGPGGEIGMLVRKPDGTPWANAPYNFDSSATRRKLAATPSGPCEVYQLRVRAGADGVARCYLEPLVH